MNPQTGPINDNCSAVWCTVRVAPIMRRFDEIDKDGDGVLSRSELEDMLSTRAAELKSKLP
jgi:hypothetical protein